MKTVRKNNKIARVTDENAESMVKNEHWNYCPKSIWKAGCRDLLKKVKEIKPISD